MEGIEKLHHKPKIITGPVNEDTVTKFENTRLDPTFFCVDPWGYKGLSLRLINAMLKDWGSDGIFFFNYNRIKMGIRNVKVNHHMESLFGEDRLVKLASQIRGLDHYRKEKLILEQLREALKDLGAQYTFPFGFKKGKQISHHLIAVSKGFLGHEVAKEAMSKESTHRIQGVPLYQFCNQDTSQPSLFEAGPLDQLEKALLEKYAGKTMTMQEIYLAHSAGTPYLEKNYKECLKILKRKGQITTNREPRGDTFAATIQVTFPRRMDIGKVSH